MTGYVRHFTNEHIPAGSKPNFRPFKIYHDGREIVRSHWDGGFDNGHYSVDHGRLTNRLGREFDALTTHYSRRSNWAGYSYVDEMRSAGVLALVRGCLSFDDTITVNAFAYLTQIVHNAFLRVLKDEKRSQRIRDRMLFDMGANPSFNYEGDAVD